MNFLIVKAKSKKATERSNEKQNVQNDIKPLDFLKKNPDSRLVSYVCKYAIGGDQCRCRRSSSYQLLGCLQTTKPKIADPAAVYFLYTKCNVDVEYK